MIKNVIPFVLGVLPADGFGKSTLKRLSQPCLYEACDLAECSVSLPQQAVLCQLVSGLPGLVEFYTLFCDRHFIFRKEVKD